MSKYRFQPDYAIPPGETLQEELASRGMTQAELADRTGMAKKTINEIIKGKAPITPDTALKLEHVFGLPAHFWNMLEQNYQETKARLAEQDRLKADLDWLRRFPVGEMIKLGWLRRCQDKVEQLQELLTFFGIASVGLWETVWENHQTAYRQSQRVTAHREAISAWLRQGEREGQQLDCAPYREIHFRKSLKLIRELTLETPDVFVPQLIALCAKAGVAVVFVPELPHTGISGATRWLNKEKALIQLSLRYKSNDHLWFTFFHEAGHILKHGKDVFLEINLRLLFFVVERECSAAASAGRSKNFATGNAGSARGAHQPWPVARPRRSGRNRAAVGRRIRRAVLLAPCRGTMRPAHSCERPGQRNHGHRLHARRRKRPLARAVSDCVENPLALAMAGALKITQGAPAGA